MLTNVDPAFPDGRSNPYPSADPDVPDIFLKYDYMVLPDQLASGQPISCTVDSTDPNRPFASSDCELDQDCIDSGNGSRCAGHSHAPEPGAIQLIVDVFARRGMRLHVLADHVALEHARVISYGPPIQPQCVGIGPRRAVNFYDLKAQHFHPTLRPFAHYAVFAHLHSCDTDGAGGNLCSDQACTNPDTGLRPFYGETGLAEIPGNDFVVTFGFFSDRGFRATCDSVPQICVALGGTTMHELGHNLGLDHGGPLWINGVQTGPNAAMNFKSNYVSVMNYLFQTRGISTSATVGDTTPAGPPRLDFAAWQPGITPTTLDEQSIDEHVGLNLGSNDVSYAICSGGDTPIPGMNASPCTPSTCSDFNCDGAIGTIGPYSLNGDSSLTDVLVPYKDWPNLFFDF